MALRVFPKRVYGDDHAYSVPFTGSGYEETVAKISRDDLVDFHASWFLPNNATLVVVGDTTLDEITPALEKRFASWKAGTAPTKNIAEVANRDAQSIYLIDRPGSEQSVIFAGHLAPPQGNDEEVAIETMNTVLGGDFVSRINMNLREDKGWSYGSGTFIPVARGQRPFLAYAPVQTDKTKESMMELTKELGSIVSDNPPSDEETQRAKDSRTLTLPGQWETVADVAGSLTNLVRFGYSDDYFDTYAEKVTGLDLEQVSKAAKTLVKPDSLVWVVVGDREKIEDGVRELAYGDIQILDADGNPVGE